MLRPISRIPQAGALLRRAAFTRSYHAPPQLAHFQAEEGVPGLLSPAAYSTAWTRYMNHVTDKLNTLTNGTEWEQLDALPLLKVAARDPALAALFNYASMAHNNHFFFENLVNLQELYEQTAAQTTGPAAGGETSAAQQQQPEEVQLQSSEERIPPRLKTELERNFSSVETLRREFLATAKAMFGPGFVWLVRNAQTQDFRILTTYLAGSPYTAAHWRRQGVDLNTSSANQSVVGSYFERQQAAAGNNGGQFTAQAPGGVDVVPLLCLNTWEHVWLLDYGIEGKGDFVEQWWEIIDWNKVERLAIPERRNDFK